MRRPLFPGRSRFGPQRKWGGSKAAPLDRDPAVDLVIRLGVDKRLGHGTNEGLSALRNSNIALQDALVAVSLTIVRLGVVRALSDRCAVQIDACEQSLAARLGKQFRVQFPICGCL
jgi:hypothetical protein